MQLKLDVSKSPWEPTSKRKAQSCGDFIVKDVAFASRLAAGLQVECVGGAWEARWSAVTKQTGFVLKNLRPLDMPAVLWPEVVVEFEVLEATNGALGVGLGFLGGHDKQNFGVGKHVYRTRCVSITDWYKYSGSPNIAFWVSGTAASPATVRVRLSSIRIVGDEDEGGKEAARARAFSEQRAGLPQPPTIDLADPKPLEIHAVPGEPIAIRFLVPRGNFISGDNWAEMCWESKRGFLLHDPSTDGQSVNDDAKEAVPHPDNAAAMAWFTYQLPCSGIFQSGESRGYKLSIRVHDLYLPLRGAVMPGAFICGDADRQRYNESTWDSVHHWLAKFGRGAEGLWTYPYTDAARIKLCMENRRFYGVREPMMLLKDYLAHAIYHYAVKGDISWAEAQRRVLDQHDRLRELAKDAHAYNADEAQGDTLDRCRSYLHLCGDLGLRTWAAIQSRYMVPGEEWDMLLDLAVMSERNYAVADQLCRWRAASYGYPFTDEGGYGEWLNEFLRAYACRYEAVIAWALNDIKGAHLLDTNRKMALILPRAGKPPIETTRGLGFLAGAWLMRYVAAALRLPNLDLGLRERIEILGPGTDVDALKRDIIAELEAKQSTGGKE